MRFTLTYVEAILETLDNPADLTLRERILVEAFSSKADRSFAVLP